MKTSTMKPIYHLPAADAVALREIINRIKSRFKAEFIFLSTLGEGDGASYEVIVLLSGKTGFAMGELGPYVAMAFADFPRFKHQLFRAEKARHELSKGNLFFYGACHPGKMVYRKKGADFSLYPEDHSGIDTLEKAVASLDRELAKTTAFREGVVFYLDRANYNQCAFMLHQFFELTYRALEIFMQGKERVTHSIRGHHRYVVRWVPEIGPVFDEADADDDALLALLDECYRATRYEDDFDVSQEAIATLQVKADLLERLVIQATMDYRKTFERTFAMDDGEAEPQTLLLNRLVTDTAPPELIEILVTNMGVEQIYLFTRRQYPLDEPGQTGITEVGQKREHLYLLVITRYETANAMQVQQAVNDERPGGLTVTLVVHSMSSAKEAVANNNRFFHRVFAGDNLLYDYGGGGCGFDLTGFDGKRSEAEDRAIWLERFGRAESLAKAVPSALAAKDAIVALSLVNQAAEQLCCGLVATGLGYKPKHMRLHQLLQLCGCFTDVVHECLRGTTERDRKQFNLLADAVTNARYRINLEIDLQDAESCYAKCTRLLQEAAKFVSATGLDVETDDKKSASINRR